MGNSMKKQSMSDFAVAAMEELERNGIAELLLLKNDQLRNWWAMHKESERRERVKQEALDRLSDEEKELLGLAPKKSRNSSSVNNRSGLASSFDKAFDEVFCEEDEDDDGDYDSNCEIEYHKTSNGTIVKTYKLT
jgi:hypothetical protein